MARACTVCTHPLRRQIDRALVDGGTSNRGIARQFELSDDAVTRHAASHLPAALKQAQAAQEEQDSLDVLGELRRCLVRVNKLYDACDRYLQDPDDPDRYDLGPRAEDVSVTYLERAGRVPIRKRATLSRLLDRLEQAGVQVVGVETKQADPRELILKTHARLQASLELAAKLLGQLDERPTITLLMNPEWLQLRGELLVALGPFPAARVAVAARLAALEPGRDN